ncbi:hypothetical protein AB0M83_24455 [Amycolatopsis sp. NPDC051106]|uniref:hypothetical protein n=1 Tax=unclassified Amycolatopsis TaxID=2618356 RepID=UPI003435F1CA
MKRIIISSLVVLFGIVAIAGGFSKLGDSTVRCGGRLMQAGDECVSTSTTGSETGRKSVDEQRSSDKAATWAAMGGGVLIVVFGTKSLVTGIRNRRKKPGAGTPVGSPPQQAGFQPQQAAWNQQAPSWNQQAGNQPPAWNQAPPVPGQPMPPGYPPQQPGWGPPPQR